MLYFIIYLFSSHSSSKISSGDDASLFSKFPIIKQIISREDEEESEIRSIKKDMLALKDELSALTSSAGLSNKYLKSPPNQPAMTNLTDTEKKEIEDKRKQVPDYGGKGEKLHLGGFTANDTDGQSPALWMWMLKVLTVKSFLDVGCGKGISTRFFMDHGADVLCVEGSHDAVTQVCAYF